MNVTRKTSSSPGTASGSHDLPSTSHQRVARTKARMKEMFYWYGMGKAVAKYVASCDVCNRSKKTDKYGKTPNEGISSRSSHGKGPY